MRARRSSSPIRSRRSTRRTRTRCVVSGSHGGLIAARYASRRACAPRSSTTPAIGLDDAGIAGLVAPGHDRHGGGGRRASSARIGDGADTLARGVVSRANALARGGGRRRRAWRVATAAGVCCATHRRYARSSDARRVCQKAACLASRRRPALRRSSRRLDRPRRAGRRGRDARHRLARRAARRRSDDRACASTRARAFFHDAGRGQATTPARRACRCSTRAAFAAATVDYRTARIGDARSMWASGVLSCVNAPLARSAAAGMSVQCAVRRRATRLRALARASSGRSAPGARRSRRAWDGASA